MGKNNKYIYQVWKDNEMLFEGSTKEVSEWLVIPDKYVFNYWKGNRKLLNEFTLKRKVRVNYWKPKNNDVYYFVSHKGIIEDYFDEQDFTRLARYNVGNCFKTKDLAYKHADEVEHKLKSYYLNT